MVGSSKNHMPPILDDSPRIPRTTIENRKLALSKTRRTLPLSYENPSRTDHCSQLHGWSL